MSTTMTLTLTPQDVYSCPNCGIGLPDPSSVAAETQRQIEDLQAQVRLLTDKATAAADKMADYQDEIQALRAQFPSELAEPAESPSRFSGYFPAQNRLSSFLSPRKSTSNLRRPSTPSTPSTTELVAALTREQELRQTAEGKLTQASGELEELSAQLFMQANKMVATERKARAKLEERVELLEKRDVEKRARLEKLEGSMQRIERVRALLVPGR